MTDAARRPRPPRLPPASGRLDLFRRHAAEYHATKEPAFVDVGPARYLALDGEGARAGPGFQGAFAALYNVAFTVKMRCKAAGQDYAVSKLEALWWDEPEAPAEWRWRLLIRVPDFLRHVDLDQAKELIGRHGSGAGARAVRLEWLEEGRCVQALHIGAFAAQSQTIERMRAFAEAHGLRSCGARHEVYVSDPRRVPPPRLRTIVRQPVTSPRGS